MVSVQEIDISSFFKKIFHSIIDFLDFDAGGIYIVDQQTNSAIIRYSFGLDAVSTKNVQVVPLNVPPYSRVFKEKQIFYAENYEEQFSQRKVAGIYALVSIPLICEKGVIGALNVASRRRHSFSSEEKHLFELMGKEIGNGIYRYLIQEELRRSEKKYRQLIETAQEGIWVLDVNGVTTFVNPRMAAMLGYSEAEMIGKSLSAFMSDDEFTIAQEYRTWRLQGISEQHESTLLTKEGKSLFVLVETSPVYDEKNQVIGTLGCITDISERKRVELELRENEEKLRNVIEQSRDGIVLVDESGKIIEWNRGLEISTGLTREFVLNRDVWDVVYDYLSPDGKYQAVLEIIRSMIREFLQTGRTRLEIPLIERKIHTPDGFLRYLQTVPFSIKTRKGYMLCAIIRDQTERVKNEEDLKESERKYRQLFENSNAGVIISTPSGEIVEWNRAMANLVGYEMGEKDKIRAVDLYANPGERQDFHDVSQISKEVQERDILLRKKSGLTFWARISARYVPYQGSFAFLTTVIDLDAKIRAEQTLQHLYEEALQISQMKSNLLTFASHELKTPLVPIVGWAEFIKDQLENGEQINELVGKEEIANILNSANRLVQIVDKFLDLGCIESYRLVLQKKTQAATTLVENAIKNVSTLAHNSHITILNKVQNQKLFCDGFRIEQVFINVLSNAIKYSPNGKEVLITSEQSPQIFTIFFQDQGYGFTPDELDSVWHPFSKIYRSSKDDLFSGTGVGLYISKGLVEMHGGTLEITSDGPNVGSCVKIRLPIEKDESEN